MKHVTSRANNLRLSALAATASVSLLLTFNGQAWPHGRTTFYTDAPFVGTNNVHSLTATGMQSLMTVSGWSDTEASIPANLYQWWWIFGVDSGVGNGALIDGTESMTLDFDKSVGAAMIYFLHTGGSDGVNNLARISISGFASDPGASAVTYNSPRIQNIAYADGVLTFDYLNDGPGQDFGQLLLSHPAASSGRTLKITGMVSPNGDATSWYAALYGVDVEEAFAGPNLSPISVPHNAVSSLTTADGLLKVKAYADRNATTPGNLGRYQDECFGVFGQNGGNVVDTNEAITLEFDTSVGLSRLDSVYSGGEFTISGFASDPGFVDASGGSFGAFYFDGVLTVPLADGGLHSFYFANRAASAGRTLRITVSEIAGSQLGIGGIGYVKIQTLLGPDLYQNYSAEYTTADGLLTLGAYTDTPGTMPGYLNENVNWFGVGGGNNTEAIEGTESMSLQFTGGAGLSSIGTRYTSGQVIISGFTADPGFNDPSGTATGVSYSAGTLSYTFNAPTSPERVVHFSNLAASQNQTLSLHTDTDPGAQIALTRIVYGVPAPQTTLSISRIGNDVQLEWTTGTLQEAGSVEGPYNDISGAVSPYTTNTVGSAKFFRVRVQ